MGKGHRGRLHPHWKTRDQICQAAELMQTWGPITQRKVTLIKVFQEINASGLLSQYIENSTGWTSLDSGQFTQSNTLGVSPSAALEYHSPLQQGLSRRWMD